MNAGAKQFLDGAESHTFFSGNNYIFVSVKT